MPIPLEQLKLAVEKTAGRPIKTPKDFEYLSDQIFNAHHQNLSVSTLKRIWGYVGGNVTPRRSSLDLLAQYVGEADYDAFCKNNVPNTTDSTSLFPPT